MNRNESTFDKFKKLSKKEKIITLILAAVVSTAGWAYALSASGEGEKIKEMISPSIVGLPMIHQIDEAKTPIMYDYVFGSIGLESDVDLNSLGPSVVLAFEDYTESVYVLEQNWAEYMYFPVVGEIKENLVVGSDSRADFANNMYEIDPSRVFEENDWKFVFLSLEPSDGVYNSISKTGLWGNVPVKMETVKRTPIAEHIEEFGWETSWLRKEPFVTAVKDPKRWNLDMNDPFWDKYNYLQIITTEDGSEILIANRNDIRVNDAAGSRLILGNEDELNSYLESKGN
ncbi:hypothetical protein GJ496_003896 [Pomphorhynchus laevis]|nr:hypothetical protein GJ496_008453 [Pomphorhynchus laevis]KAI0988798.1 hypothetical protein GJ496_003896 [Pomphorhynchus laevis]